MRLTLVLASLVLCASTSSADFDSELAGWRAKRVEGLLREESWTSLVGLHWLESGPMTMGSAAGNDLVVEGLPARFATVRQDGARWLLALEPGVDARVNGQRATGDIVIRDPAAAEPESVAPKVVAGRIRFVLIERAGRIGMRVWDTSASMRKAFPGLDWFEGDESWLIRARWQPHVPPRTIDIATVIGTIEPMPNPGSAVFERDGRVHELQALQDPGSDELFFIFADRTSGRSTYGAGRYLYTPMPADGVVELDFNRAFNPPCVFTEFATCPLPPPANRLDLHVTAGEKTFLVDHAGEAR